MKSIACDIGGRQHIIKCKCVDVVGKALLVFSTKTNDKVDVSHNYDFVARGDGSREELSDEAKLFSIPSEATAVEELCPQNR